MNKKITGSIAILLLLTGLCLRLYDLDDQPIDFHPTRQLRSAIIARGMYYEMSSSFDDISRQAALAFSDSTGKYEPPILERIVSLGYAALGKEIPWLARLLNSIAWVVGGMAIYDLSRRMRSRQMGTGEDPYRSSAAEIGALAALAYYLVLPFSVQASRSFQPDPGMVVWISLAAWSAFRWSENPSLRGALITGALSGLAILTKAVAAYPIAGLLISLVIYTTFFDPDASWSRKIARLIKNPQVWIMMLLSLAPSFAYYSSRGDRASEYFTSWTISLSSLLLKPTTYLRWINLVQQLITPAALVLAVLGILMAVGRSKSMLVGLFCGYIAYGLFLPYQMTTHSYYHLQLVPIIALSMVPVLQQIFLWVLKRNRWTQAAVFLGLFALMLYGSWQALIPLYSRSYRNEPEYWSKIAKILPEDGKIIALTQDYGYRLMYYGWRKVVLWPNRGEIKLSILRGSEKDFQDFFAKRIEGKRYFLITAFNQYEAQPELQSVLSENFPVFTSGSGYLIFDLLQNPQITAPESGLVASP